MGLFRASDKSPAEHPGPAGAVLSKVLDPMTTSGLLQPKLLHDSTNVCYFYVLVQAQDKYYTG